MLDLACHAFKHVIRAHGDGNAGVIQDLEIVQTMRQSRWILFVSHGVDSGNKVCPRLFPKRDDRIVRPDIPVQDSMLDAVDPGFQQFLHVVIIENMCRSIQAVFFALADDLLHQSLIDFANVSLFIKIPVVASLIGEFQEIYTSLFQLPDPFTDLLGSGNLNSHFRFCPQAV